MKVYDPIYGEFVVPPAIATLVTTPEFRRLSQIRLLNCITPTLATLGEIRRYSHTLGVVRLAMEWLGSPRSQAWREVHNEFLAAILLHDIATPPFGHIFEYLLKERFQWDHEELIVQVLRGTYAAENTAHQIFAHKSLSLLNVIHKAKLDPNVIIQMLEKTHPLSKLIFGTLDFDNLDNVTRMTWALGLRRPEVALSLSRQIAISETGDLRLPRASAGDVAAWADARRACYETIVFDPETSAAQAVLTEVLRTALDRGVVGVDKWDLTDEDLLTLLLADKDLKDTVADQYLARLPVCCCIAQWTGPIAGIRKQNEQVRQAALRVATDAGVEAPLIHVFWDNGTFEKRLIFLDDAAQPWSFGNRSESLTVYFFSRSKTRVTNTAVRQIINDLHDCIEGQEGGVWNVRFPRAKHDAQVGFAI